MESEKENWKTHDDERRRNIKEYLAELSQRHGVNIKSDDYFKLENLGNILTGITSRYYLSKFLDDMNISGKVKGNDVDNFIEKELA